MLRSVVTKSGQFFLAARRMPAASIGGCGIPSYSAASRSRARGSMGGTQEPGGSEIEEVPDPLVHYPSRSTAGRRTTKSGLGSSAMRISRSSSFKSPSTHATAPARAPTTARATAADAAVEARTVAKVNEGGDSSTLHGLDRRPPSALSCSRWNTSTESRSTRRSRVVARVSGGCAFPCPSSSGRSRMALRSSKCSPTFLIWKSKTCLKHFSTRPG